MHWQAPRQHGNTSTGVHAPVGPSARLRLIHRTVKFPLIGNGCPFFPLYVLNGSSYDDNNDAADGGEGTHREVCRRFNDLAPLTRGCTRVSCRSAMWGRLHSLVFPWRTVKNAGVPVPVPLPEPSCRK